MLILLLRVVFVTLAILIGLTSGSMVYNSFMGDSLPPWFGGAMGFGIAITLIACEHAFRRRFTRSLVAFLLGLGAGLGLTALLLLVLRMVIQNSELVNNLDLPLALITTYLVLVLVLRNVDNFRVVVPFVEFRAERADAGAVILDGAVLADGRINALVNSGLLPRRLLIHRQVLLALETGTASSDTSLATRSRRALEGLTELRHLPNAQIEIDDTELPNTHSLSDVLMNLVRLENGRLLVADRDIITRARNEGLAVIDIGSLASALSPTRRTGEQLLVSIEKLGDGRDQGIGFLDDGSMVVVTGAASHIGKRVQCTIMRLHQTSNGRMVFAEVTGSEKATGNEKATA
jgi:uncharacterized protein YacL